MYFKLVSENPFISGSSFFKSLLNILIKLSHQLALFCCKTISAPSCVQGNEKNQQTGLLKI